MRRRRERARAARAFAQTWAELLTWLPCHYVCYLTCTEAEMAAWLLETHGHVDAAERLIAEHSRHDEPGDVHYRPAAVTR